MYNDVVEYSWQTGNNQQQYSFFLFSASSSYVYCVPLEGLVIYGKCEEFCYVILHMYVENC